MNTELTSANKTKKSKLGMQMRHPKQVLTVKDKRLLPLLLFIKYLKLTQAQVLGTIAEDHGRSVLSITKEAVGNQPQYAYTVVTIPMESASLNGGMIMKTMELQTTPVGHPS